MPTGVENVKYGGIIPEKSSFAAVKRRSVGPLQHDFAEIWFT